MKHITLGLAACMTFIYADLSVQDIQKMVLKIHEKRVGIGLETLDNASEPFVHAKIENNETTYVPPAKDEVKLALHAILNKKVFINDNWYKEDDIVMGYELKYIGKKGVVLKNETHIRKLFLHENKENYISIEEKE